MVKQLSFHVWCDLCLGDGQQEDAMHQGVAISIRGARPLSLDLCERHHKELLQPILQALADHGVDPTKLHRRDHRQGWKRKLGPLRCLVPGCMAAPLKNASTFEMHLQRIHGMTLDEYIAEHGDLVPLSEEELAKVVVEARCYVKGCDTVYSTELGHRWPHQALRSHLWGLHGIKMTPGGSRGSATVS